MKKAELKDRLKFALKTKRMKAVELCNQTNIPTSAMSYYMSGRFEPKADRIYLMAKALDVSEAWLMGYDVPMERPEQAKKDDKLVELVVRLRRDNKLFSIVSDLSDLPDEQLISIGTIIAGLKSQHTKDGAQ